MLTFKFPDIFLLSYNVLCFTVFPQIFNRFLSLFVCLLIFQKVWGFYPWIFLDFNPFSSKKMTCWWTIQTYQVLGVFELSWWVWNDDRVLTEIQLILHELLSLKVPKHCTLVMFCFSLKFQRPFCCHGDVNQYFRGCQPRHPW